MRHARSVWALVGLAVLATAGFSLPASAQETRQELYFDKPQSMTKSESALLRGDAKTAKRILLRALERGLGRRHRYTAHNNLCVAFYMLKEYEDAVAHCKEAIKIRSNRWRAYNNLGNALAALGRFDAAIEAYEKGLDLASADVLRDNLELVLRRKRMREPRSELLRAPAATS